MKKTFQVLALAILFAVSAFGFACSEANIQPSVSNDSNCYVEKSNSNNASVSPKSVCDKSQVIDIADIKSLRVMTTRELVEAMANQNRIETRTTFTNNRLHILTERKESPPNDSTYSMATPPKRSLGNFQQNVFYQRE